MNERNEIMGDAIESVEAELLANAPEGERGFPEDFEGEDFPEAPEDNFRTDAEADADVLASAGMGTDEDYGHFGGEDSFLDGSYEM